MIKLYKKTAGLTEYWEAWSADNEVTVHWGVIGERGTTRTIPLKGGEDPDKVIAKESQRPKTEGYKKVSPAKHARIIVQYRINGMGTPEDLDRGHEVEGLMNECLGWLGLGDCDGNDIGSGTMNIFCFVVDSAVAIPHIVGELKAKGLLEGAVVAISSEEGDTVVWPKDFTGEFSI